MIIRYHRLACKATNLYMEVSTRRKFNKMLNRIKLRHIRHIRYLHSKLKKIPKKKETRINVEHYRTDASKVRIKEKKNP